MTRVWLTPWEWECCGDPFEVGDEVDFGIAPGDPAHLVDKLGPELAGTVEAWESHHEEERADRVRGEVVAVHEVSREVVERKFHYFVDRGARDRTAGQPAGEQQSPDDVSSGAPLSRESVRIEPVPGTTRLAPVLRVPPADGERTVPRSVLIEDIPEMPDERRRRVRVGWLVDVDETRAGSGRKLGSAH